VSPVETGVPTAGDLAGIDEAVEPGEPAEDDVLAAAELDETAVDADEVDVDEPDEHELAADEVDATALHATITDEPEDERAPEPDATTFDPLTAPLPMIEQTAEPADLGEDEPARHDDLVEDEPELDEPAAVAVSEDEKPVAKARAAADARAARERGEAPKYKPYHSKRGTDALAPLAILVALACAAVVGRMALMKTLTEDVSLAATLTGVAFVLLLYALRSSNSSRSVHIDEHGILKVTRGDMNSRFDLTSPSTQLEMVGTPGHRNWRLLIIRRSMSPVVIDSKTVDARSFTEAVRQWRPEL
jgi:hypothetical protein